MLTEVLALLALLGGAWCMGVAFAIYRAVVWQDRMRAWARGPLPPGLGLACEEIDSMGWN